MFTLALASFASYRYCYLQFQTLSTFYGILSTKHLTSHTHTQYKSILFFFLRKLLTTPNTSHVSGIECQNDWFPCFEAYIWSFSQENVLRKCAENSLAINWKWNSLTFP